MVFLSVFWFKLISNNHYCPTLGAHFPQVSPVAIISLRYHRLHLWLFIFNPFRVGTLGAHFPQVAPVAIISLRYHRLHMWLFIFNPFGVGTLGAHFPQVAPVTIILLRYHRLHLWLFTFNPFGVGVFHTPGFTGCDLSVYFAYPLYLSVAPVAIISQSEERRFTLSRSARYFVSTPLGLACSIPQVSPVAIYPFISRIRCTYQLHLWLLSRRAKNVVSHSTPSGLARWAHIFHRFHLWLFIFNPFGVGTLGAHFPQVAPVAIHIQPLWGWNVGRTFPTGSTCGYSYSTPLGLGRWAHIFHRFHLWLFIFNPFRVGTLGAHFPQVAPVAIHIQPLWGWRVPYPRFHLLRFIRLFRVSVVLISCTCDYYLAARYTAFQIQPRRDKVSEKRHLPDKSVAS
jgi:hypothetical protein